MIWSTATIASILALLAKAVAQKAVGWGTGKVLQKIFGGENIGKETLKELSEIIARQKAILDELDVIFEEIQWDNAIAPARQAELSIKEKYNRFQEIANLESEHERKQQAKDLFDAVMDENDGVLNDLFVLNAVLLGQIDTNPQPPIYQLFYERNLDLLRRTFSRTSIPMIYTQMTDYELALAIIQFMGMDLYVNAALSSGDPESALQQVQILHDRLTKQQESRIAAIPKYVAEMATLSSLTCTMQTDQTLDKSKSLVMYGEPPNTNIGGVIGFRDRHPGNQDEEWVLERLGDGTYALRGVARGFYVFENRDHGAFSKHEMTMLNSRVVPWRLIPSKEYGRFNICRDDGRPCFSEHGGTYDLKALGRVAGEYRDTADTRWHFVPL